jgi:hypothetical protein
MDLFNWILIDKETQHLIWGHKSVTRPMFGNNGKEKEAHDKLEYIDYRTNTGTGKAPIWEGRELPEWLTDDTPAKWNGKELVKDE